MAVLEQRVRSVIPEIMTSEPPSQNCSDCSRASEPEFSAVKAVSLGLVLGSFILFGVVGNILVILSVACHRQLRTVTNYFIVNLAAADLLLSATVLPFSAIFEILDRWVFGRVLCTVWAAADVLCCTASIMSLCVISVDRYVGVSYPLRYPAIVTEKRALWAVVALWVLSVVISIGPLFGWKEPAPEDEAVCKITEEPAYAVFSAVGSFYLPLAVILVMYFRVYVVAHRESRGLKEGHKTEKSDSECVTLRIHKGNAVVTEDDALRSRTHFALRLLKFTRQKKAAKTLGIVVGCFVLCWLPFFLVLPIDTRAFRTLGFHDKHRFRVAPSSLFSTPTLLLRFTYIDCITMSPEAKHTERGSMFPEYRPSDTVFKVTFWLGYFNSCINPIIYPCSNLEFRKAFQSLLGIRCLRAAPRPPLHLSPVQSQGNAHPLTLHLDERRLSPSSSSVGLSRTPSFRDSREWRGLSGRSAAGRRPVESSGAKVAKLCRKSLRTTCCCRVMAGDGPSSQEPRPVPQPPLGKNLPTIKIHQLSLSENGEPV